MTDQSETNHLANKIAAVFINAENTAEELRNQLEVLKRE